MTNGSCSKQSWDTVKCLRKKISSLHLKAMGHVGTKTDIKYWGRYEKETRGHLKFTLVWSHFCFWHSEYDYMRC